MPNEVIIEILRKQQASKKKTLAAPSRRDEELGRRRTGGIRFYDLGYIKSGDTYINLPYVDSMSALSLTYNADGTRNNTRLGNPMTLADFQADLYDLIFEVPVAEWKDNYKQIDETMTSQHALVVTFQGSGYSLTTASSYWSNGVFRPTVVGTGNTVIQSTFVRSLVSLTGQAVKVTNEANYAADSVSFTLTTNCDIFLIPRVYDMQALANSFTTGTPVTGYASVLNALTWIAPRDAYFDPTHPYYNQLSVGSNYNWLNGVETGGTYATSHPTVRYWQTYQPLRARQANRNGAVYTDTSLAVADFAPSADWPDPPSTPGLVGSKLFSVTTGLHSHAGVISPPFTGELFAVIMQGGRFYYFWNDET